MAIKTPELDFRKQFQKNHIINGNFDFWQRGTTFTDLGDRYTADRFFRFKQGGLNPGVSTSRQAISDLAGSQYCMRVQRTSGSSSVADQEVVYAAETKDAVSLAGKVASLSFYARKGSNFSATSSTMKINLTYGTGTDQAILAGYTGQVLITQSFTLTTGWTKYTVTFPAFPSNMTQWRFEFIFTPTGTAGAADYFEIAQIMLNEGSEAFPFVRAGVSIGDELRLCQRYYEKSYEPETAPGSNTTVGLVNVNQRGVSAPVNFFGGIQYRVIKRTTPTVTFYNKLGTINQATTYDQVNAGAASIGTPTIDGSGPSGFVGVNHTLSIGSNHHIVYHYTADAEL